VEAVSEQDSAVAQTNLGFMCANGQGGDRPVKLLWRMDLPFS
jgi:hypothetical protein